MRSVKHFYNLADALEIYGVRICTCDGIDYSTPIGRLIRGVLLDVAQFEGELLVERTREGLEKYIEDGGILGRPRVDVDLEEIIRLLDADVSKGKISKLLGCSHATINNRLRDAGRADLVASPTSRSTKKGMLENRPVVKYSGAPEQGSNNRSVVAGEEDAESIR
jgi:DNA invertase Pin-like site-specific DNA recombinase